MRTLPIIIAVMVLGLLCVMAAPAMADVTIPINKDYKYGDMVIHIIQVSITNYSMGNEFSPDPANTVWPKLVFKYENTGTTAKNGNLEVAFFDDKGKQYPDKAISDVTMNPIAPGTSSENRFVEAAVIPQTTKITRVEVFVSTEQEPMYIDLPYENANYGPVEPTASPQPTQSGGGIKNICCLSALLPLVAGGVYTIGRVKR